MELKNTTHTHQEISKAGVDQVTDVLGVLLQFLVLLVADVVQEEASDVPGDGVDLGHVTLEERAEHGHEVGGVAAVDVAEDEVEVLDQLLEVFLMVVELLGAHVAGENVQGAVSQDGFGFHGFVQFLVNLEKKEKKYKSSFSLVKTLQVIIQHFFSCLSSNTLFIIIIYFFRHHR